jgi:hypothetical protein
MLHHHVIVRQMEIMVLKTARNVDCQREDDDVAPSYDHSTSINLNGLEYSAREKKKNNAMLLFRKQLEMWKRTQ